MPFPENFKVAKLIEQVVRDNGAIPATIAALSGEFRVGTSSDQLESLAELSKTKKAFKISRGDISYVATMKLSGGTTVAGTMILAHLVGIHFFATGGIGGVHRGAEVTMDISTDLTELGRTPVCVVCAGIKSILDISKTLEVLETKGVPVTVLNSDIFPSFFTNDSGIVAPLRVNDVQTLAKMYYHSQSLQLENGMLVAVQNPNPANSQNIKVAIDKEVEANHIIGNKITPYLLARIEQLTNGASFDSNISLILNNAKIAAQIAVEHSILLNKSPIFVSCYSNSNNRHFLNPDQSYKSSSQKSSSSGTSKNLVSYPVLIFGGAVVDIIAKTDSPVFVGTSNPGKSNRSFGGVGRNIAENLSLLHKSVGLVTVVGDDENGRDMVRNITELGIDTTNVSVHKGIDSHTAHYIAIHNYDGDLFAGVADMKIFEKLDPKYICSLAGAIRTSCLVIVDGNISSDSFTELLNLTSSYNIPVLFEPTSDHKCLVPITTHTLDKVR
jgi:pseudouridine-5'-phosphate glycosidase/pseudouridine kinase